VIEFLARSTPTRQRSGAYPRAMITAITTSASRPSSSFDERVDHSRFHVVAELAAGLDSRAQLALHHPAFPDWGARLA
jgi:hypothetical protein